MVAEVVVVEAGAAAVEAVVQDLLCVRSAAGLTAVSSFPCCPHCVAAWPSPSCWISWNVALRGLCSPPLRAPLSA